jgi:hypothetical protein
MEKDNPDYRTIISFLKEGGMMADLHELNKDTPAEGKNIPGSASDDPAQTHRRLEREAEKLANRGNERQRDDDADEFRNIGPV